MRYLFVGILLLIACAGPGGKRVKYQPENIIRDPLTEPAESFFKFRPKDGYLFFRGYKPSIMDSSNSMDIVDSLENLITSGSYCKENYGFEHWISAEERIYKSKRDTSEILIVECDLLLNTKNVELAMSDFFSHAFRRNVSVVIGDGSFGANYTGPPIVLRDNNSEGHRFFDKDGVRYNFIFWRSDLIYYEAVYANNELNYSTSLDPFFESDTIKSKELTQKEASELKRSLLE